MIKLEIPNSDTLTLEYAVIDYNGTIAMDGVVDKGVADRLVELSKRLKIYVATLDTFGNVKEHMKGLPVEVKVVPKDTGGLGKKIFVNELGADKTVCISNGCNDIDMFEIARLSLIVLGNEGMSVKSFNAADVAFKSSTDALEFLLSDKRMIATLRR